MTYIHEIRTMCDNQFYDIKLEDENDAVAFGKIIARVRSRIFEPAKIEIISYNTKVKESLQ